MCCYSQSTVVWEIFACNNFRMLKFHMGKFLYNNGCSKFERVKRDFRLKKFFVRYIRKEQGVHACHGGVRKGLLYSRLPRIQRYMAGSYRRGVSWQHCHRSPSRSRCLQQQSLVRTDFGKGDLSDQADRPRA